MISRKERIIVNVGGSATTALIWLAGLIISAMSHSLFSIFCFMVFLLCIYWVLQETRYLKSN